MFAIPFMIDKLSQSFLLLELRHTLASYTKKLINSKMLDKLIKSLLIAEVDKILSKGSQNKLILAMRYMLFAPTKYIIRPLLITALSQVFNIEVISIAVAVKCVHTHFLIQGDLPYIDNSNNNSKNQLSCCYKKFNEATAVLVAEDAPLTLVYEILSSPNKDSNKRYEIIKSPSQIIGTKGMVKEQVLDSDKDFGKIKEIHLMKTAKLLTTPCEIGAIAGDTPDKQRRALYNYRINLGLIFQAEDDIENYKQALDNLSKLRGKHWSYPYDLLNQAKKDG